MEAFQIKNKEKMNYKNQYIGEKLIANVTETKEVTPSGVGILMVEYADETKEYISSLMIDYVLSESPCDLSELRDKRLRPIVEKILELFRDWGLKLSELSQVSLLLNQSIDYNHKQAMIQLWSKYANVNHPEEVDMLTLDKVLKEVKPESKDAPNPNQNK